MLIERIDWKREQKTADKSISIFAVIKCSDSDSDSILFDQSKSSQVVRTGKI